MRVTEKARIPVQQPLAVLVMAKAPVPGQVKTRLCPPLTPEQSAGLAAAALLDTLDVVEEVAGQLAGVRPVIALAGELTNAVLGEEIRHRLSSWRVIPQRGEGFAVRLANAHLDAAGESAIFQIGMDTPQLTATLLGDAIRAVRGGAGVIGPATDGGWWGLGLPRAADAGALRRVVMSTADTRADTVTALRRAGVLLADLEALTDADTIADARLVAASSTGRFAALFETVAAKEPGSPWQRAIILRDNGDADLVGVR